MMYQLLQLSDYTSGGLLKAALTDLAAAVGGDANFGLLVGGVLLLSFYIASNGGLATPATATALVGGIMIPALPPGFGRIAQVIIVLGLMAAIMAGLEKYVSNTPT